MFNIPTIIGWWWDVELNTATGHQDHLEPQDWDHLEPSDHLEPKSIT